ncbi:MAG: LPS translocon maturation chaperone LptM, partial [Stenotrophobium sp.]
MGTKSWPSAPRPCSQITAAVAETAGSMTTASEDSRMFMFGRWIKERGLCALGATAAIAALNFAGFLWSWRMNPRIIVCSSLLAAMTLTACGQSGALYLP